MPVKVEPFESKLRADQFSEINAYDEAYVAIKQVYDELSQRYQIPRTTTKPSWTTTYTTTVATIPTTSVPPNSKHVALLGRAVDIAYRLSSKQLGPSSVMQKVYSEIENELSKHRADLSRDIRHAEEDIKFKQEYALKEYQARMDAMDAEVEAKVQQRIDQMFGRAATLPRKRALRIEPGCTKEKVDG